MILKCFENFSQVLKKDFCSTHWLKFQSLWLKSILDWDLLSFKTISVFCQSTDQIELFNYKKILAKGINDAWQSNLNKIYNCNKSKQKNPKEFLLL